MLVPLALFAVPLEKRSELDSLISALERSEKTANESRIDLLVKIGRQLYPSDPDSAMSYVDKAEQLARTIDDRSGLVSSANLKGVIHYLQGEYAKVLPYWKRVLKLKKEKGTPPEIANIRNNLGLLQQKMGAYVKAMKQHQAAFRIRDSLELLKGVAESSNNLGIVHYQKGDMVRAENYYKRALKLKKQNGWTDELYRNYNNLGLVFREKGQDARALKFYRKAIKLARKKEDRFHMGRYHLHIGNAFRAMDEHDSAFYHFKRAFQLHKEMGNKGGELDALIGQAEFFIEKGELQKAVRFAREAYRLSDTVASLANKKEASDILSKVSAAMGNYKKAFKHKNESVEIQDSLWSQEKEKQVAKLEARFQASQKEKELKALRMEQREAELKQQRTLLIAIGGGGGLLLLLAFLVYGYRQKKKANELLAEQNNKVRKEKEEKELLLQELHHRVKNNLQLILSLLNLQTDRIKDEEALQIHKDSQNRVRSMGMLHDKIQHVGELDRTQFEHFVRELSDHLVETYGMKDSLELQLQIEAEGLGAKTLTPVALILNELLSNALKYGFKEGETGAVFVSVRPGQGECYLLEVRDNGLGFGDFEESDEAHGDGMDIVRSLTEQLEGELLKKERERGACLQVYFKNID